MTPKSFYAPAAGLVLLGGFAFASCSKSAKSLEQSPLPPTTDAFPVSSTPTQVWDVTLPAGSNGSGPMEVTEWVSSVTGEVNTNITTTLPAGFVMVGGGAQVQDPGGNPANVDAILTASYPVNNGAFNTWAASNKDHGGIFYTSDLFVYVIGIKLFDKTTGAALDPSVVIPHLSIFTNTSGVTNHPSATASVPSGAWTVLSSGAQDNYTGYGNLLVENDYSNSQAFATGKDQKEADPASITAYALAYDNQPIGNFGTIYISYNHGSTPVTTHLQGLFVTILSNYAVAGVGGLSTYTGYGRLLYGTYSATSTSGQFQSKDQDVSDVSGTLSGVVTYIAPL